MKKKLNPVLMVGKSYENSQKDPEHIKSMNSAIDLQKKIMALLGPNSRLFLEYEMEVFKANEINQAKQYYLEILNLMQSGGKTGYLKIVDGEIEFVETVDQVKDTKPLRFPLSAIRTYKGYTEDEAAEYCGVSVRKMKRFESDPGTIPASIAMKLRGLYGIPLDYISL